MDEKAIPIPDEMLASNANQIRHGRKVLSFKFEEDMTGKMFDVEWVDGVQKECGDVVES